MKKKIIDTFVAIDFETLTKNPTSVCAAGYVKVKNGIIHEQWYSLVKPVEDNEQSTYTWLHGITREMTAQSPDFTVAHAKLRELIADGSPIVCHNSNADMRFIEACENEYGLKRITNTVIDTYQLCGQKLNIACQEYGIDLGNHHDALCDARACAQLMLALEDLPIEPPKPSRNEHLIKMAQEKHIDHHTLSVPTEDEISNKSTIFYHSNCVITGKFQEFPLREELAAILRSLGADINTAISGKTTLVVAGEGFGPKKMADIEKRQANGQQITLIGERELMEILAKVK